MLVTRSARLPCTLVQVGAVPVRKDDEVTVVRGTYKVGTLNAHFIAVNEKACKSSEGLRLDSRSR